MISRMHQKTFSSPPTAKIGSEQLPGGHPADVALIITSLSGGGAERVFLDLAGRMASMGLKVDLVLAEAEGAYISQIPKGVRLVDLAAPRRVQSVLKLAAYLRKNKPRRLLSTLLFSNVAVHLAARLARYKGRIVLREANTLSSYIPEASRKKRMTAHILLRRAYENADAVVGVSDGVVQDLRFYLRLSTPNLVTIYNPMPRVPDQPARHPHPFFQGDAPVLIAAGRLRRQKRFDILLDAFARVRRLRPAKLIIFGYGDDHDALHQRVAELGMDHDVDLPGFDERIFEAMSSADLFVMSSDFEGLPNVLIQALGCGLPVVSTDCPSGPREILSDGRYGALVEPGDAAALADAITTELDTPRIVDVNEAVARFSPDVVAARYLDILEIPRHDA